MVRARRLRLEPGGHEELHERARPAHPRVAIAEGNASIAVRRRPTARPDSHDRKKDKTVHCFTVPTTGKGLVFYYPRAVQLWGPTMNDKPRKIILNRETQYSRGIQQ